ncbi:MAG: hypothetical protein JJT95_15375 [Pararhodobacter sp.]|nr:hypothetical protein [Pararhodobacter sp.]
MMPRHRCLLHPTLFTVALGLGLGLIPHIPLQAEVPGASVTETNSPVAGAVPNEAGAPETPENEVFAEPVSDIPDEWLTVLGLRVLNDLTEDPAQTQLISPLGLATVLAMLADGAEGTTAAGYAQGLGLPANAALDTVAAQWQAMAEPGDGVVLQGASGLWLAQDFEARTDYIDRQQAALGAELATVDFEDPGVLDQINTWFSDQTAGMIPNLLDDLSPATRIVLGNALYLNARWQSAFDPDLTRPGIFTTADGTEAEVQMMQQEGQFLYREAMDHQAVNLPFADPDFVMTLYLPADGTPLASLSAPGGALADTSGFRPRKGLVELPRLDLRVGGDLSETLRAMGMLDGTDHAGLTAEPLLIERVVQQVALRLDETGAEAAAATAAVGVRSAMEETFSLRADRPFAIAITHLPSSTALFMGVVNSP